MENLTEGLAKFAVETQWEDLPSNVVRDIKMLLLDSVGCALAGISTDPGKMIVALSKRLGGPPESSIIGVNGKVSCSNAALANGQLINTIDYDAMPGHAPPFIIPAPLALAESKGASGKDLIVAFAIGFEISARVGNALSKGSFFGGSEGTFKWAERSGYASCNFGAAAGTGKIMRLDIDKMVNALGIAGHLSQVPTWIRYTFSDHRPMTKYGVPGWQNTGGVMAALLAEMGYMGDTTVFDTEHGFWKFVGYGGWNPDEMLKGIGKTWNYFTKITFKPYPCCRMFQTELDCFIKIIQENNLKPAEIESVKILGHPTLEAPCFTNREITNIADIQFGPAYIFAMAANDVPKGVEWQDLETAACSRIQEFAKKVSFMGHSEFLKKQMSVVEVVSKGQVFKEEKIFSQLHELSNEELLQKFRHNASRILTENKIEKSIETILELEKVGNISEMTSLITL
jgi:2-methylcitrate dehydratase PrpD